MRRRTLQCPGFPPGSIITALQSQSLLFFRTKAHRYKLRQQDDDDDDEEERDKPKPAEGDAWGRPFHLHKGRGQHILTNPRVLDSIVRRASVRPTDTVLEIGPGSGNLTVRLLEAARRVVSFEIDDRMVDALHSRVSQLGLQDRLTVIMGDALQTEFPPFDLCVANIPYGISSPLIAKLLFELGRPCGFRSATLLLQKEFARRLLASPGDSEFNRLAANVRLVATVELLMDVSKKDFVPCPKVDSSLVRIRPRSDVPAVDLDEWLAFTRTCFSKKNKTLGAIFKQKKKIVELFERSRLEGKACKVLEEEEEEDGVDDDDDDDQLGTRVGEKEAVNALELNVLKEKVVGILKAGGFEDKRPSKLSTKELLHLLQLFNQEGVLFH
ncbi:ribosomal RNA small subunit methyltransferase, mitochondrial [Phoenix dactylifera]|uniref:rRNA adenine N(6)-methyltransferase n=1 Tax=Phoenix dactylifera TaxID=42345 RepID=A0A8B7CTX4_PHODC|nr:ribosomal RNA small subunit methyltransferase, mitochondrial [Phoenix dactylifera]